MLGMSLGVAALLGLCFGLKRWTRYPIEVLPVIASGIVITLLYVCAYAGFLRLGAYAFLTLGVGLLLTSPSYIKTSGQSFFKDYLTPGFTSWMGLTALLAFFAAYGWPVYYDDFGEWMPHAAAMLLNNGFIIASNVGLHNSYPPGPDLFYYLFLFLNTFSTPMLRVTQTLLIMTPFAAMYSHSQWKHWKFTLSASIFVLFFAIIACDFPLGMKATLDSGWFAGLAFGAILLVYYQSKRTALDIALLLPLAFSLALMKSMLLPFLILISALLIADQLFQYVHKKNQPQSIRVLRNGLTMSLLITLVGLIALKSWALYLTSAGIGIALPVHLNVGDITRLLAGQVTSYQHAVFLKLWHYSGDVVINTLPIVLLALFAFYSYKAPVDKKRFLIWQCILAAGFVAYLIGLIIVFLFGYHSVIMVVWGFLRFYRIYLNGWWLLLFGLLFVQWQPRFSDIRLKVQLRVATACVLVAAASFGFWGYKVIQQSLKRPAYAFVDKVSTVLDQSIPKESRVVIVWKDSRLFDAVHLSYNLNPRYYMFSNDPLQESVQTYQHQQLGKLLQQKYNYLILLNTGRKQHEQYIQLYRITPHGFEKMLVYPAEKNGNTIYVG